MNNEVSCRYRTIVAERLRSFARYYRTCEHIYTIPIRKGINQRREKVRSINHEKGRRERRSADSIKKRHIARSEIMGAKGFGKLDADCGKRTAKGVKKENPLSRRKLINRHR